MDMSELIDPFARLIEDICTPAAIREIEQGGDTAAMWKAFLESGFLDALVAEESGGAGLSLSDAASLIALLGRHAVPLPVGDTMVARALLAAAGVEAPEGPIAIATGAGAAPFAAVATHILSGAPDAPVVTPANVEPTGVPHDGGAYVSGLDGKALRPIAAALRALLISGAAERVMEMTVAYANERVQFGKPIGKQQAVQQQLSVLAEQAVAARIAAAIGARAGLRPKLVDAAIAKHGTSLAAGQIAAIAHAVHGAIGISEEYDLQLLTRRLHGWRLADGSEGYWAGVLGELRMAEPAKPTADFIRGA
ncbi:MULTISPECIES: acyl-CoA dehydrogenase family protein [Sphingobium]|uniref:Acyl-CoA dehydrogenase family protein n=1 Tax=Sphingobium tyrosinilyticum TaxID=2715436 RepID=A0ABV9EYF0_9SPHN|nr:acyl-CoA dehydrogenase [Sphingobium sp. EP60837]ANI79619.1 Medium-chain acyl-CoA dehydrogenase [Sphingobium sp. EP60837]